MIRQRIQNEQSQTDLSESDSDFRHKFMQSVKSHHISMKEAFALISLIRCSMSVFMPIISDCDETFNYWEPSHYLNYGYGLQTWEYSPEFKIRSWLYVALHSVIIQIFRSLWIPKRLQFYLLKCALALISSFCETILYQSVSDGLSPQIANYMLIFLIASPGMYIASSAYLPSSFAMYASILAYAFIFKSYNLKSLSLQNTITLTNPFKSIGLPIFFVALGSIVGWPFMGLIAVPIVFEEVFVKSWYVKGSVDYAIIFRRRFWMVIYSTMVSIALILIPCSLVDSIFYRQFTMPSLNIVLYNVFKSHGVSSDVYGTEPFDFYFKNLILNFNIGFVLAIISIPYLGFQYLTSYKCLVSSSNVSFLASSNGRPYKTIMFKLLPMYLWLLVLNLQHHKEERFMFVIYPVICIGAAITLSLMRSYLSRFAFKVSFQYRKLSRLINILPQMFTKLILSVFILLSVSRIISLNLNYSAQLDLYARFQYEYQSESNQTLCLDRDWYRFPSHFLLNENIQVQFLDSDFNGQLPKYFVRTDFQKENVNVALSWLFNRPGTHTHVQGFNSQNQKEKDRFIKNNQCNFYIRLYGSGVEIPQDVIRLNQQYKIKKSICLPILDTKQTNDIQRYLYVPFQSDKNIKWGNYCLHELN